MKDWLAAGPHGSSADCFRAFLGSLTSQILSNESSPDATQVFLRIIGPVMGFIVLTLVLRLSAYAAELGRLHF